MCDSKFWRRFDLSQFPRSTRFAKVKQLFPGIVDAISYRDLKISSEIGYSTLIYSSTSSSVNSSYHEDLIFNSTRGAARWSRDSCKCFGNGY